MWSCTTCLWAWTGSHALTGVQTFGSGSGFTGLQTSGSGKGFTGWQAGTCCTVAQALTGMQNAQARKRMVGNSVG